MREPSFSVDAMHYDPAKLIVGLDPICGLASPASGWIGRTETTLMGADLREYGPTAITLKSDVVSVRVARHLMPRLINASKVGNGRHAKPSTRDGLRSPR